MSNNSLSLNANANITRGAGIGAAAGAYTSTTTGAMTMSSQSSLTGVTITNAGTGYISSPIATFSAAGGGGGGASIWTSSATTAQITSVHNELVIYTNNRESIRVAETLYSIMDLLGLLRPNTAMLEKYPSLQSAWDDYKIELNKSFKSPELQAAIESYKMIEALVKADENGDN